MLDLDAIEARAKAATPGPWVCRPTISTVGDEILEAVISKTAGNLTVANDCLGEDGDFIAHAREDIPALIAELRKLREEGTQLDAVLLDRNMKIAALAKRVEGLEAMVAAVGAGAMTEPLWAECVSIAERRAGRAK